MHLLTITTTDASPRAVVSLEIEEVDPTKATIAILRALESVPKPRKPRKDKGAARKTADELAGKAQDFIAANFKP